MKKSRLFKYYSSKELIASKEDKWTRTVKVDTVSARLQAAHEQQRKNRGKAGAK